MPPMGYSIIRENGVRKIVVNEKGKLIRKAFLWKALESITNEEICQRLTALGLKLADQRLSDIFRNPFYCGLMVHNMLDGNVVEGKHEKMISREIFLKANNALPHNKDGIKLKYEREDAPLKRFLKCEKCREFYTAYRKKETIWYYKCNTKGCNCNLNAKRLHEDFKCLLQDLSLNVSPSVSRLIARDMEAVYLESNKESSEQKEIMNRNLTEVNNKLLKLNERFIEEDLDRETYRQMKEKFEGERGQIERQLTKSGNQLSNLEKCIELAIEFSSNLASLWDLSDYGNKQRIQYLVFPQGIFVDKENNDYRTPKVNSVFLYFARLKRVLEQNKTGKTACDVDFPGSVVWAGIEPATQGFSVLCSTD
jgi:site-specific DNA recombinase